MLKTSNADICDASDIPEQYRPVPSQLARVLDSSHFRNSKRSQALLRFVVETTLAGDQNSLKERVIGAAVFGRDPAYDTAQDPVVRNAAIDVRKRLAQYYMEPNHTGELRIELPVGSYHPIFSVEAAEQPKMAQVALEPLIADADTGKSTVIAPADVMPVSRRALKLLAAVAVLGLLAIASWLWYQRRTPATELEAFWQPLLREGSPVQVFIGQPTRVYRFTGPRTEELNRVLGGPASQERNSTRLSVSPAEVAWVAPEYLFLRDALAGFNVAAWIQAHGRAYQLMSVAQADYARLRHVPLVAIGAFNNAWAMRVTSQLRFSFEHRTLAGTTYNCIIDSRHPDAINWKVAQPAGAQMTEDFAIVTRVFDPDTEKTVVSAAGIETYGTLAAGEFVTHAEYLGEALRAAPESWRHGNVQFVLGTKIIDGSPGPPKVLAAQFW